MSGELTSIRYSCVQEQNIGSDLKGRIFRFHDITLPAFDYLNSEQLIARQEVIRNALAQGMVSSD